MLTAAWHEQSLMADGCTLLTRASLPLEAQTEAGAPAEVVVQLSIEGDTFNWDGEPHMSMYSYVEALSKSERTDR